jgi:hypothetical protein
VTGGATGDFSASLRVRKMRKTLRMLIPNSSAASALVLPASTKAKTCLDDADIMHLLKGMLKASGNKGVPQGGVVTP